MIIGIDPGNDGAVACWASPTAFLWVRRLDGGKLTPETVELLREARARGCDVAIVEEPTYDPARSGHHAGKVQQQNVGYMLGALGVLGFRVLRPTAQEWRRITHTSGSSKKARDAKGRAVLAYRGVKGVTRSGEVDACLIGWAGFVLDGRGQG